MKIISAFVFAFTAFCYSCCSQKTTAISEKPVPAAEVPAVKKDSLPNTYRFVVSFYSIAAGPERAQVEKFEKFIADNGLKIEKAIEFEKSYWGREGEVDFCMNLNEFSASDQQKFIAEAKVALSQAKRVNFSENAACKSRRK